MDRIRVVVVDDSLFMRKWIANMLESDPRIEVTGTASNGFEALEKISSLKPDVVTMDIEMPGLNGLEVLKTIMEKMPLPVIMLSSTTREGAEQTIRAMEWGAFDFIQKPSGNLSLDLYKIKEDLIEKVVRARSANLNVYLKTAARKQAGVSRTIQAEKASGASLSGRKNKIVLVGASTGGPKALQELLINFSAEFPAPILIVQHMPAGFTKSLAERLNDVCEIPVKEAEHGELLRNGTAYIAPGGKHMEVRKLGKSLACLLSEEAPVSGHRPSVDCLFHSASMLSGIEKIAVILTGMGSDGSQGLIALKRAGDTYAIAESEETAVIYGMPKSAIQTGFIDQVAPLNEIPGILMKKVNLG